MNEFVDLLLPGVEARHEAIKDLAQEQHCTNEIDIVEDAAVSEGDENGAWVQAWVWVNFEGTPLSKPEEDL